MNIIKVESNLLNITKIPELNHISIDFDDFYHLWNKAYSLYFRPYSQKKRLTLNKTILINEKN